ncbi:beta-class carbonic anhydrase [Chengkuizengella axinellae]|uniref:carbonic anhydrase n=1 Tax=Chengkuizengella axinellae TaxID=3064388 RepID=A0ABT9IX91_9BACL|nr:carbonic anhydrase [Chengkuizengella sp. 2205SS18-9]MDP5273961.1 carbonic anhydrase [Chengkuizengella sp. 2205SS18-9]
MSTLTDILKFNEQFVENKQYEQFRTSKFPDKKMVILTCMDTRLVELLPKATNIKNGDAKILKTAGAIVREPFGNVMRSILVAIYKLNAEEVYVIGHHGCGMTGLNAESMIQDIKNEGISDDTIKTIENSGVQLSSWLKGFDSVEEGVKNSVTVVKKHPLLPVGIPVHGLIIHPETGQLEVVVDGYNE